MPRIPESVPWQATGATLGEGGQSHIQEVKPREGSPFLPGLYAMKIPRNVGSAQARQRFIREVGAIRQINHERVVKILDFSKEGDFLFYVMPKYDGYQNLGRLAYTKESPFLKRPAECLEFIAKICEALQVAHDKKIVHRDIRPDNILVHVDALEPVLLDFGCCQVDGDESITLLDEGVGTKDYMAPECEPGSGSDPTASADIYSLGKVLWSIVTGRKAFARERPAFTNMNLSKVLPDHPECWHLTSVFEPGFPGCSCAYRYGVV